MRISKEKISSLLAIKKRLKRFKFIRHCAHKQERLSDSWRRPRRKSSLMRVQIKGKPLLVKIGYRTPKLLRNKTEDGKNIVRVCRLEDLKGLDPKKDAIIVARVGKKNKIKILQYCFENKFDVLNHDSTHLERYLKFKEDKEKKSEKKENDQDKEKVSSQAEQSTERKDQKEDSKELYGTEQKEQSSKKSVKRKSKDE
ncbi:MAG: eL32 family ribosomal protein [Candidatus Woesearchaeota archaeon]